MDLRIGQPTFTTPSPRRRVESLLRRSVSQFERHARGNHRIGGVPASPPPDAMREVDRARTSGRTSCGATTVSCTSRMDEEYGPRDRPGARPRGQVIRAIPPRRRSTSSPGSRSRPCPSEDSPASPPASTRRGSSTSSSRSSARRTTSSRCAIGACTSRQTEAQGHRHQARGAQRRRQGAGHGDVLEDDAERRDLRRLARDRRAVRRRRHRRPHAPGRPPRRLRPARLHLHARRRGRLVRPLLHEGPLEEGHDRRQGDATAADVASAINAKGDAPVFASVIKDPDTARSSSSSSARKTGKDSEFTLDADRHQAAQSRRAVRVPAQRRRRSTPSTCSTASSTAQALAEQRGRQRDRRRAADAQGRHLAPG